MSAEVFKKANYDLNRVNWPKRQFIDLAKKEKKRTI